MPSLRYVPNRAMSLLECLKRIYPDSSGRRLKILVRDGKAWVGGKRAKLPMRVEPGMAVEVRPENFISPNLPNVRIVYEDEHLLAVDKQADFLSVATDKERTHTAFHQILGYLHKKEADARLYVVHRLDYGTSGLLLFAKTKTTQEALKDLFAQHNIQRYYRAVVAGHLPNEAGTFASRLAQSQTLQVYVSKHPGKGKHAITHYRMLQKGPAFSLLELRLETGRRGQIRVQLAHGGHPIVGDHQYGGPPSGLGRLCLHAHKLEFKHPITHKPMILESPMPPAFMGVLRGKSA